MPTHDATDDPPRGKDPDHRAWILPLAVSLVLHAGAILGLGRLALGQTATTPEAMSIQLVPMEPASEPRANAEPRRFSELPPNRADANPEGPKLLSNVTSRARDPVAGGEVDLPRTHGAGDAPMVNLEPRGASHPSTAPPAAPPQDTPADGRSEGSTPPEGARVQDPSSTGGATAPRSSPREGAARESSDGAHPGVTGNSGIHQPESAEHPGHAALTGDISLSTTAWDYAPWLQRYRWGLLRQWTAPPAYYLGILKEGGWAVVEVEISRTGKVLRCEVLEQQGHPSLTLAAENAVRWMAPIEPLPGDFPETTLILRIRMIYPKLVPR